MSTASKVSLKTNIEPSVVLQSVNLSRELSLSEINAREGTSGYTASGRLTCKGTKTSAIN